MAAASSAEPSPSTSMARPPSNSASEPESYLSPRKSTASRSIASIFMDCPRIPD